MPAYILTGTPGSGKTAVPRLLETFGHPVGDSLAFEQLPEQTYRDLGFLLADVPAGPLADRVEPVRNAAGQV